MSTSPSRPSAFGKNGFADLGEFSGTVLGPLDSSGSRKPQKQAMNMVAAFGAEILCKLCMLQPEGGKSAYEKDCRRKVEGVKNGIKDKEGQKVFAERNPDPTRLRLVVKEAEETLNPDGEAKRSKPRAGRFDIMAYKEYP